MAIELRETFQVRAPIDAVWGFMMDPARVVTCVPGAELREVVDERTFVGAVKVKVGAITASYTGRVRLTDVDEQAHAVQMVAEGRDAGGGTARGSMSGHLRALAGGQTEVIVETRVELTGRIMQVGRGMIQGVARQLFQQFVASTVAKLEAPQHEAAAGSAAAGAGAGEVVPVRILPLVLRVMWAAVVRFLRRLAGRLPG